MVGDVPVQVTQQPPNRQEPTLTVPQDLPPPYQPAPHPLPTHMYMQAPNTQYIPVGPQPQPPNAQYVPVVHQVHPATQYVPVVHQPRPMVRCFIFLSCTAILQLTCTCEANMSKFPFHTPTLTMLGQRV